MCYSKNSRGPTEYMRQRMYQLVDNFCDHYQDQRQGAQQQRLQRQQLEDGFNDVMLQTVDSYFQDNSQESSPLLPEVQQELRSRVWRSPVPDLEEEEDPVLPECCCGAALRWFQRLLYSLQRKWQAALAWLKTKVAAGLQLFCRAVEAVCSALKSFCASVAQVFRSATQA